MARVERRCFLFAAGAFIAVPFAAEAQQAAKVARIGYLAVNLAAGPHLHEAFRKDCATSVMSRAATS